MKKILLLALCFILVGCKTNKELESLTYDNFNYVLTNNAFIVKDNISIYANASYITESYEATYNDDLVFEYVKYDNEESAEKVLKGHIESFNMLKSTGASEINETGQNYHKYILISNNYYMTSTRIDKTIVFSKTKLTNKDLVEKVLGDLLIYKK